MVDNPNHWKFLGSIQKLKEKENKCFVCGSTKNIVPHHLKKVKQSNPEYYSENNLVLLCDRHHHEYHKRYSEVNLKTFLSFSEKTTLFELKKRKLIK